MTEAEMTKTELKSKSLEIEVEDFLPEWVKEFKRILEEAENKEVES